MRTHEKVSSVNICKNSPIAMGGKILKICGPGEELPMIKSNF